MNNKIIYILLCALLWFSNENEAQTAICVYRYQYHSNSGYKNNNASYYTCYLSTERANFNAKLTKIDGTQHETGHTDDDVKWLINFLFQKMKTFSSAFCQKFPNLKVIQMENVELESIDEDSLLNCKHLENLSLYRNKILSIPENLFLNQKELVQLYLNGNQINFLPSNIFHPLVKLEDLYLNNNKLHSINPEWFVNLHILMRLGLDGNQISKAPSKCFTSLKNLKDLSLFENRIKTLNPDSFDGLQNLQIFDLHTNEIFDLPAKVFAELKNLRALYLYNNKLTTIHSDSFSVHNQLTRVYLEDNKINAIDENFIDNTPVSTLNMKNNICSTTLFEFRDKREVKLNLKRCFENYQPRSQLQTQSYSPSSTLGQADNNCGRSKTGRGNIIGGTQINSGDFPWIAALVTPKGQFFCGGTLVSSRKVVTAAHCIQEKRSSIRLSANDLIVLLGVHDLNNFIEIGRVSHAVFKIVTHPDWNTLTQSFDADIAVLVMEKEVTFNEHIQPICLEAPDPDEPEITTGAVIGYGKSEDETKLHENIPKILKLPIHENEYCFAKNDDLRSISSGRTFCGGSGSGIGVCLGDSGSGLMVTDGSTYYLRGVVSSSLKDGPYGCDVDSFAVFTDVLKFIDWINGISTDRFTRIRKK